MQNITEYESEEQVQAASRDSEDGLDMFADSDYNKPVDYNMYKTFWDLQSVSLDRLSLNAEDISYHSYRSSHLLIKRQRMKQLGNHLRSQL